ncbi:PQQ-dependent sugar dehydrogenase [Streptomyces sp. RFCAC02]|uniref:PQQ-dependent sugar dehydrogenase n=1 Tax=Streptomyces sp. RFCAC02 TaxID=2499143 RepID=UPI001021D0A3|nr:PQQ-dependent sugar dehydrogenase [Streptomyces sp. RFCAC02]
MRRGTVNGKAPAAGAAVMALALLLAGCSSDDGDGGGGSASASPGGPSGSAEPEPPGGEGETPRGTSEAAPAEGSADVVETVASGLDSPWGLVVLPDGDLLVGARDSGEVRHVAVGTGTTTLAGTVPDVADGEGEGGLLGLALAPDFADSGLLYAYVTTAEDNRVVALAHDPSAPSGERLTQVDEVLTGIPRGEIIHDGGALAFGPDGMLYASTGDTDNTGRLSQDPDSLAGKILRIDPATGEPPADNPDPDSHVYSSGHRNVQGLAWDSAGRLWATELGDDTWDELNLVEPGGDHGWPDHEGRGGADDGRVDPVEQWPPAEASPSGLAFQGGSLWVAGLRGERLWRVPLDGSGPVADPAAFLVGEFGRLRTVVPVGDDELLLVTNETDSRGTPEDGDDRILRLRVT